jgi:hypothetical protein
MPYEDRTVLRRSQLHLKNPADSLLNILNSHLQSDEWKAKGLLLKPERRKVIKQVIWRRFCQVCTCTDYGWWRWRGSDGDEVSPSSDLASRLGQSRDDFKQIADHADMGHLKDRRVGVLIDGDDPFGVSHAA